MRKLRNQIVLVALLGLACAGIYAFFLTDEAKNAAKSAAKTVGESYRDISDAVQEMTGIVMEDDGLANRASAESQWEDLGY